MHLDLADDTPCRCGHKPNAHQHFRGGTECSLCLDCPRFRTAQGRFRRLAAAWLKLAAALARDAGASLRRIRQER
jgi:hypothetical protein